MDNTALLASIVVGLLTGFLSSAFVAKLFTRRAEQRERRMVILQKAHDVARDCQSLLDVTDRILHDLGCRKYAAHQLARDVAGLTGEEKRRAVNRETMRIHLQEDSRGIVDNLGIALAGHLTAVPRDGPPNNLFGAAKEAVTAASTLSAELTGILPFHRYYTNVEFEAEHKAFVDFVETMEQHETAWYQTLKSARDAARSSLLTLIETSAAYSVEEPKSSLFTMLSRFTESR